MPGNLSFEQLQAKVDDGSIDTVVTALVDMQGRMMGKRFHAADFQANSFKETHCCNYLLATDIEMATPDGYAATSWQTGYGDYTMRPDMSTLRMTPWADGTALVFCDVEDHSTHAPVPHSPRSMLRQQIERLSALGYDCAAATEP